MEHIISQRLKTLRKEKNMTQGDLAEDICSQGMISKIEKDLISPDLSLVIQLAARLNVTVAQLIGEANSDTNIYEGYIQYLLNNKDYALIEEYIKSNSYEGNQIRANKPYYTWLNAIILNENYLQTSKAIDLLIETLNELESASFNHTPETIKLKVNLLNTLANMLSNSDKDDEALIYFKKAVDLWNNSSEDPILKIKAYYGLARHYLKIKDISQCIFYAQKAIQISVKYENLALLDSLYLLLAKANLALEKFDLAQENLDIAQTFVQVKSNTALMPYINLTQANINDRRNTNTHDDFI